jgi:hypothetical protein
MSKTPLRGLEDSEAALSQVLEIGGPCRSRTYDQEIKRELPERGNALNSSVSVDAPLRAGETDTTLRARRGRRLRRLTARQVHLIRTSGKPDIHYARLWRMTAGAIYDARTGKTHADHETPPDRKPRAHLGNWGDLS